MARWIFLLPLNFGAFIFGARTPWVETPISISSLAVRPAWVFVLAFVYAAFVVDPEHAADWLAKQGGAIAGVAPGESTADYLDRVVSLTRVGRAVYLTVPQLIPEAFVAYGDALPYNMGGGAALIVVCTISRSSITGGRPIAHRSGGERQ